MGIDGGHQLQGQESSHMLFVLESLWTDCRGGKEVQLERIQQGWARQNLADNSNAFSLTRNIIVSSRNVHVICEQNNLY